VCLKKEIIVFLQDMNDDNKTYKQLMIAGVSKFIDDTIKIKGKWSMKRVLVAACFPYALYIGNYIVKTQNLNPYAIQVFATIFLFISTVLGVIAYDKKRNPNTSTNEEMPQ